MSRLQTRPRIPFTAASALAALTPVSLLGGASALDDTIVRTGSFNELAIGITAAAAGVGAKVGVYLGGIAKAVAAASLGNGAALGVGSTNGRLIPLSPSSGAAPTALRYIVGYALEDAADAAEFKVLLQPAQFI